MSSTRLLFQRVCRWIGHGGWPRLRDYERQCIKVWKAELPAAGQGILDAQLAGLVTLYRLPGGKVSAFGYTRSQGREDVPRFPLQTDDHVIVARMFLRTGTQKVMCNVRCIDGVLSELVFDRSPMKPLARGFQCEQVKLLADVMEPVTPEPARPVFADNAGGELLARIREQFELREVRPPVGEAAIMQFLELLDVPVPEDYLQLLRETDGFRSGDWEFYGTRARLLPQPDGNYHLAAETDDSQVALAFREGATEPAVVIYDEIGEQGLDGGREFVPALLRVMAGRPDFDEFDSA